MRTSLRLALLLAVAALGASAFAGTAGRDAGTAEAADCNKIAFPSTLQPLINGSRPGDVICLVGDVFRGPVLFEGKSGVTLRGAGARQTIIAGGDRDSLLIFNSQGLTFEDLTLYFGHPANAYIYDSTEIDFARVDVGGGGLGIHYDAGSRGRVSDSFVYAMDGDGILSRRGSNVTVERNWVFANGGVGVSTVAPAANTTVVRNIISDNEGPGVFGGQTPCALLPPGFVEVPEC